MNPPESNFELEFKLFGVEFAFFGVSLRAFFRRPESGRCDTASKNDESPFIPFESMVIGTALIAVKAECGPLSVCGILSGTVED